MYFVIISYPGLYCVILFPAISKRSVCLWSKMTHGPHILPFGGCEELWRMCRVRGELPRHYGLSPKYPRFIKAYVFEHFGPHLVALFGNLQKMCLDSKGVSLRWVSKVTSSSSPRSAGPPRCDMLLAGIVLSPLWSKPRPVPSPRHNGLNLPNLWTKVISTPSSCFQQVFLSREEANLTPGVPDPGSTMKQMETSWVKEFHF